MTAPASTAGAHRAAITTALLGNFVVGSGVLVVPGMLDPLAQGLGVSVPAAGSLLSLAALAMCVGAPLLAAVTSNVDRRLLLVASLLLLSFGHLLCALAPNYAVLAWVRPFSVIGAAVFTPQVAATLGLIVAPQERPAAVTTAFVGWSLASVLAMPLGNIVAYAISWRASFALIAVLALLAAVLVWRVIPSGLKVPPLSLQSWHQVLGAPRLRLVLLATMAWCAGHFLVAGYITSALRTGVDASPALQAALMGLMGACGVAGNLLLSRGVGRFGADRCALLALGCVFVGLVGWTASLSWLHSVAGITLAIAIWGSGNFAFISAQQARLAQTAPDLASASIALNSSSLYAGQAMGAALGGVVVATFSFDALGPIAVAMIGVGLLLSASADRKGD